VAIMPNNKLMNSIVSISAIFFYDANITHFPENTPDQVNSFFEMLLYCGKYNEVWYISGGNR
jgi:hypothetical protein